MTDSRKAPLRVILLTQWFDPEPQIKGLLFARRLTELGFEIEVVTGFPNYPGGKLYPGYRIRRLQREEIEGVAITRLPLYPSHDRSKIRRALNYVSFMLSAWFYLTFMARRADVVYVYHPPITVGLAAVLSQLARRRPIVIDIQDMWPDTLRATGMVSSDRLIHFIGKICNIVYRRCDIIVAQSKGFRELLVERGIPAERIHVVYNWADETAIGETSRTTTPIEFSGGERFRVLFAGNLGTAQALDSVLDAARILQTTDAPIEFCLLGDGVEAARLKQRAQFERLDNVRFLPRVSMEAVGSYLAAADCLLVHLRADPLFSITVPSKTQAYMAAGRPLLMAVEGEAAELVQESGGGLAIAPENSQALVEALLQMASWTPAQRDATGAKAAKYYNEHLSLAHGTRIFANLFRSLAAKKHVP